MNMSPPKKLDLYVDYLEARADIINLIDILKQDFDVDIKSTNCKYYFFRNILYSMLVRDCRPFSERFKLKIRKINSNNILYDYIRYVYYFITEIKLGFISNSTFKRFFIYKTNKNNNINLFISIPKNECFLLEKLNSNSRNFHYIYSWDHYLKIKNLSYPNTSTLVWSEKVSNQIKYFHNVEQKNIFPVGSTQFSYIPRFPKINIEFEYEVLVHNCWSDESFIRAEIELILYLKRIGFDKIKYRLYPNLSPKLKFFLIDLINNIGFPIFIESCEVSKTKSILESNYIFHTGSTIGIESMLHNSKVCFYKPDKTVTGWGLKKLSTHNNLNHLESFLGFNDTYVLNNLNFSKDDIVNYTNYSFFNSKMKKSFNFNDKDVYKQILESLKND